MKNYDRNVKLICPLCGNDSFSNVDYESDDLLNAPGSIKEKCAYCGSIFTKDELLEANKEQIDATAEEMIQEALGDFEKELKKALRK